MNVEMLNPPDIGDSLIGYAYFTLFLIVGWGAVVLAHWWANKKDKSE